MFGLVESGIVVAVTETGFPTYSGVGSVIDESPIEIGQLWDGFVLTDPIPTAEEQAVIDLVAAGVSNNSVTAALFLDSQGAPAPLNQINAEIMVVVNSSGLSLNTVSGLVV